MLLRKEIEVGGKILSFETGKIAKQADAAVMARCGDTMVLATVVASKESKKDFDYFPLQVEYREKLSAAGKIPGGFLKREGRPTDKEVLSARLIDRPIRPLFPKGYKCETQIIVTVFSADQINDSDTIGACAASCALMLSDSPFLEAIGEVRVAKIDGNLVVNPTFKELETSQFDITVAGTIDSIMMVEGESKEISEEELLVALKFAHVEIKKICEIQIEMAKELGVKKREYIPTEINKDLENEISILAKDKLVSLSEQVLTKEVRSKSNNELEESVLLSIAEKFPEMESDAKEILYKLEKNAMRNTILNKNIRLDGRTTVDIRPITIETGLLPRAHGSALFTRGETQSLTTTTLGTKLDEQIVDGLLTQNPRRFMLHYNFPPFSTGEVGRLGTSRREVGHGNLAERAIKNLIPAESDFAYTLRVVSDIMESNGSSSMATVCAGSLSLFDAGVPLKKPVAGIAMGLIKEENQIAILSDILGNEDFLGDMDFKVAGTVDGITALQMDIKITGLSFEIIEKALAQAKIGRMHILNVMNTALSSPKSELSEYAPRLTTIKVPVDFIGAIIGPGGKNIKAMVKDSGVEEININDDGTVVIAAMTKEACDKAVVMIGKIIEVPEVGKVYTATVKKLMEFGVFVEILPGKEGLVHVSQLDVKRIEKVAEFFKVGDVFDVKLLEIDNKGRLNLSRKVLLQK